MNEVTDNSVFTEYHPEMDLINNIILHDKRTINIITGVLADAPEGLYEVEPIEALSSDVHVTLYVPRGSPPSKDFPPIIISTLENLEDEHIMNIVIGAQFATLYYKYKVYPTSMVIVKQQIGLKNILTKTKLSEQYPFIRMTPFEGVDFLVSAKDCLIYKYQFYHHPLLDVIIDIGRVKKVLLG